MSVEKVAVFELRSNVCMGKAQLKSSKLYTFVLSLSSNVNMKKIVNVTKK